MTYLSEKLNELKPELIALRRDFHKHPELGFQEYRTQGIVKKYLENLGLEVYEIAGTGVVGILKGALPGKTILLRSDMDGIPMKEQNDFDFASQNDGVMHACGHDGHLSMLLGAAKVLSKLQSHIQGTVKFAFQPNEEEAGAYKMIEEGIMNNPKVDAAVGMHLWSQVDAGKIDIDSGPVMAASHYFELTIHGRGGHAGFAHEAIDPILVASNIIQSVQAIQTREIDALNPAVIMFTQLQSGTSFTIVPEKAVLKGSLRFLYNGGEELRERFERIVRHTCEAHQATYELKFQIGNNLLYNDEHLVSMAKEIAIDVFGSENHVGRKIHTMAGEDFSEFTMDAPGVFMFIGIRNPDKGIVHHHHHPLFDIDEDALLLGVEMFVRFTMKFLSNSNFKTELE